jgi:truncated hemoglobin YjbI
VKRSYHGDMLAAHQNLGKLPRSLFPRWLALFYETVGEFFMRPQSSVIMR